MKLPSSFSVGYFFLLLGGLFSTSGNSGTAAEIPGDLSTSELRNELIVLAAPITGDPYYADAENAIFDFHVEYARQIKDRDDFLILTDETAYERYAEMLGKDRVVVSPMADIWARDYGLSNTAGPVMFRYTAAGQGGGTQGQRGADVVQHDLITLAQASHLRFRETHLLNDGGNFVDDDAGNAVISRKFLRDNDLNEEEARVLIQKLTDVKNVAFINSDEQGGLSMLMAS